MQFQPQIRRTSSSLARQGDLGRVGYAQVPSNGDAAGDARGSRGRPANDCEGLCNIIRGQPVLAAMLVFVPTGYAAHFQRWDDSYVFGFNFLAIIPLAWLIGKSTEDVASSLGQTMGGLLNATFGNVVEMILCVSGIQHNLIVVVQCTLLGSILSNLLLVLGTAFLVGGICHSEQFYSKQGAATQCTLMVMAVLSIGLPTLYANILGKQEMEWEHIVQVSRWSSIFLLFTYLAFLYFQIGTHRALFESDAGGDGEEEEEPDVSPCTASVLLGIATVVTTFSCDFLIGALKGTLHNWSISEEFIGIIMLPIIGNAAEHYTAITVAARDKMDLSLGVAAGSSCQMALFVTPFTVLVGWGYDVDMTLDFHEFQLAVLLLAVFLASTILSNGASNWLEGLMLLVTYLILALIYFFEGTSVHKGLATLA